MADETFKTVSVAALRAAHQALAEKAVEDDAYLPLFAEVDAQLSEYETRHSAMSPIELARARLRRQA